MPRKTVERLLVIFSSVNAQKSFQDGDNDELSSNATADNNRSNSPVLNDDPAI